MKLLLLSLRAESRRHAKVTIIILILVSFTLTFIIIHYYYTHRYTFGCLLSHFIIFFFFPSLIVTVDVAVVIAVVTLPFLFTVCIISIASFICATASNV